MPQIKQSILVRIRIAFLGLSIFAALILVRILSIQVVDGERWLRVAQENGLKYREVSATRGNILSDNGGFLATSLPFYQLAIDATIADSKMFEESVDSLSVLLANFFEDKTDSAYAAELREARLTQNRYYVVSRRVVVSHQERKALETWPLIKEGRLGGGAIFEKVDRRFRPYSSLARRTVGFLVNTDSTGEAKGRGLEFSFNDDLAGIDGEALYQRIAGGRWKPVDDESMVRTVNGHDIQTTLNVQVQEKATEILESALQKHKAKYGTLVLMEVETGEIKAMVNLGLMEGGEYAEDYNYAVQGLVEPGSTMKTASMMALLEATDIGVNDTVNTEEGQYMFYDDCIMIDAALYGYGKLPVQKVFEKSSNIGVSKLIFKHFQDRPDVYVNYLDKFGLTTPIGFQMKGEGEPVVSRPGGETWSGCSLPWLSIGYEIQLTPLQMLTFYNGIANAGKLIEPLLVKKILKASHFVEQEFTAKVINPKMCSDRSLYILQGMLEGVVERGTADNIYTEKYKIAGKTGTTHKVQRGKYVDKYYTSFVGYFPADRPKYSCIVAIDEPRKDSHFGGDVAAPVFREMADWLFVRGVDHHLEDEPSLASDMPSIYAGNYKDIQMLCEQLGLASLPMNTESWVKTQVQGDTIMLKDHAQPEEFIPDVRGMSLKDALYLLENRGVSVRVIGGKGRVKQQSLYPGRKVRRSDVVYLTLG